jgi:hypothetical protein
MSNPKITEADRFIPLMFIRGENTKYVEGAGAADGVVVLPNHMLRVVGDDVIGLAQTCYSTAVTFRMPLSKFCELDVELAVA